ncbi:MAG: hypothetical protein ACXV7G_11010 [Halobacteriota archaeon]
MYIALLKAIRIDDYCIGSADIIEEIMELIEKAEFLIFDLTYARPNVYMRSVMRMA